MNATKDKRRVGRPTLRAGCRREQRTISMDPDMMETALRLGGGNLSAGVHKALTMAQGLRDALRAKGL
jgi:hypothetical protein